MAANRADAVKTALLVVGGSGAVAGLYVAYRKQRTDEANHLRDQDKLFTERYTAAAAQLGHDKPAVRLAGVYALARIADDSERDRPTCIRVLCSYLRMAYDPASDVPADRAEREVRAAAQAAVAERLRPGYAGFWPGADIDLTGAQLIDLKFADIAVGTFTAARAVFHGGAVFDKATFHGVAVFDAAVFTGNTDFRRASFEAAARFGEVRFDGKARFDTACFAGDVAFGKAKFGGYTVFSGSVFTVGGQFNSATFAGETRFVGAKFLKDVKFSKVKFGGFTVFTEARFGGGSWFSEAMFIKEAGFIGATFRWNAWFAKASFAGPARFRRAAFESGGKFGGTTFRAVAEFAQATFGAETAFDQARFPRDRPPVWPDGFPEPSAIVWDPAGPPNPAASPTSP